MVERRDNSEEKKRMISRRGIVSVHIGDRIRILRERRGMSQKHLAHALNMPNQSLSNYERGYREPPAEVLKKLADYFEVSVDYLLGRESVLLTRKTPRDLKDFLDNGILTYNDVPLDEKDIEHIRQMLEYVVEYKKKTQPKPEEEEEEK